MPRLLGPGRVEPCEGSAAGSCGDLVPLKQRDRRAQLGDPVAARVDRPVRLLQVLVDEVARDRQVPPIYFIHKLPVCVSFPRT